jgi:hypothetical protein
MAAEFSIVVDGEVEFVEPVDGVSRAVEHGNRHLDELDIRPNPRGFRLCSGQPHCGDCRTGQDYWIQGFSRMVDAR